MSSRSSSEFGSLADRVASRPPKATGHIPTHVDVRDDNGTWQPGLLIAWHHPGDTWWGRTIWAPHGEAIEELVHADRLRPTCGSRNTATGGGRPSPSSPTAPDQAAGADGKAG